MVDEGKISVVVPVYNVEEYLDQCVESLVGQTYKNLEVILVDDGSPDNCPAMCDEWAERDNRIKVIHKENGGVSSARNAALDIDSGDYIGFVDSDDWIEPDMYEILIKNAKKYDADISRCAGLLDYCDRSEEYNEVSSCTVYKGKDELIKSIISDDSYVALWTGIYKSSVIAPLRFDNDISVGEDWLMNYLINKAADRKVVVKEHKYHYVQHENNTMSCDTAKRYSDRVKVVNIFWNNEFSNTLFRPGLSRIYSSVIISFFKQQIRCGKDEEQFNYFRKDLRLKIKKLCGVSFENRLQLFMIAYIPGLYSMIYKLRQAVYKKKYQKVK